MVISLTDSFWFVLNFSAWVFVFLSLFLILNFVLIRVIDPDNFHGMNSYHDHRKCAEDWALIISVIATFALWLTYHGLLSFVI